MYLHEQFLTLVGLVSWLSGGRGTWLNGGGEDSWLSGGRGSVGRGSWLSGGGGTVGWMVVEVVC